VSKQEEWESELNRIEKIAKETFGYDDDSLLAEFEAAEQEARELQNKGSFGAEKGLRELTEKIQRLDIQPIYQADYEAEREPGDDTEKIPDTAGKRPFRWKRISRVLVIAAVMGALGLGSMMVSVGKLSLKYWGRETGIAQPRVVWNNVDNAVDGMALEEAYQEIESRLGIHALQLGYFPKGMEYQGIKFANGYAVMEFVYQGRVITFVQMKPSTENSWSPVDDRIVYDTLENEWLGVDINLSLNELENNQIEYQGDLVAKDTIYSLQGIMDEETFHEMLEGLSYIGNQQ